MLNQYMLMSCHQNTEHEHIIQYLALSINKIKHSDIKADCWTSGAKRDGCP
jgi:hypothetical protein